MIPPAITTLFTMIIGAKQSKNQALLYIIKYTRHMLHRTGPLPPAHSEGNGEKDEKHTGHLSYITHNIPECFFDPWQ